MAEHVVTRSDRIEQVYIDGIHGISFGATNSKLELFQILPREDGKEARYIEKLLVLPSAQLLEFCRNVLAQMEQHEPQMRAALRKNEQKMFPNSSPALLEDNSKPQE